MIRNASSSCLSNDGDEFPEACSPDQRSPERAQGLDELFLAEQFVDRLKYVLERYGMTMQSMNNRT
jgi:hypothetical protein